MFSFLFVPVVLSRKTKNTADVYSRWAPGNKGGESETIIGNGNNIREFVTIHRGTEGGGMRTVIGDQNLLMAYVHVAHDVIIHNHTIVANGVTFAGHVTVEDYANIGGLSAIHQFHRRQPQRDQAKRAALLANRQRSRR